MTERTFGQHVQRAAAKTAVAGVALGLYAGGQEVGNTLNPDAGKPDTLTMQPHQPSPAERLQGNFDRRMDRVVHRHEFNTGLVFREKPLETAMPSGILQHKDVPAASGAAGWRTLQVYDTDTAWRQADLVNSGHRATHFTDGYFYTRGEIKHGT